MITAAQGVPELTIKYMESPDDPSLTTPMYVAYSKGIINKMTGAAYLLSDGSLLNFKNRYGERGRKSRVHIDFVNSEIED